MLLSAYQFAGLEIRHENTSICLMTAYVNTGMYVFLGVLMCVCGVQD